MRLRHRLLPALAVLARAAALVACATGAGTPPAAGSRADRSGALPGAPAPASEPGPILAGAAARAITPDVKEGGSPVRMAGFGPGRDAQGVHDDLDVRALVLQAGSRSVALVALDLIGLFHDDVVRIREEIRARHPEAAVEYVMVASTHTHAGPDIIGLWTPPERTVDAGYVARIRSQAVEAVAEAWARRRPARLSFASARLPQLIEDSRLPRVIDDLALMMKVDAADGRSTIATLVDFADHPESLGRENNLISSDYPGATRRALEERFGGTSIFFSADIGGLLTPLDAGDLLDPDTGRPVPRKSYRMTELLGQAIARALGDDWSGGAAAGAPPDRVERAALEIRAREFRVPLANQRFARGLAEGHVWPRERDAEGALRSEAAVLSVLAEAVEGPPAGDPVSAGARLATRAQFACVPGEIYPELVIGGIQDPQDPGADIQKAPREPALRSLMAGRERFVLGLCNDELGYIIPMSEWDEQPPFAYGRSGPQYGEINSTGPRTAPILLDLFADLLR